MPPLSVELVNAAHGPGLRPPEAMARGGSRVILVIGEGCEAIPRLGGFQVVWTALVGLCRQVAAEYGPHSARVNWLLSPSARR
jgi:hypothetical protein